MKIGSRNSKKLWRSDRPRRLNWYVFAMFLSERTMKLLLELDAPTDQKVALLNSMRQDELAAIPTRSKGAERQARYQARLEASGMSQREWRETSRRIIARDQACAYCGATAQLCCDHVEPLSSGGSSDDANLVAACAGCNREKSGRPLEQWKGEEWAVIWRQKRHLTSDAQATLSLPPSPQTPQPPTHTRECVNSRERNAREEAAWSRFWGAYPRKVSKAEARKAFSKAFKKLPAFDEEQVLIGGLERAQASWVDAQFIPHAATWLNQERWNDEPEPARSKSSHERPHHDPKFEARQANLARAFAGADLAARQRWEP